MITLFVCSFANEPGCWEDELVLVASSPPCLEWAAFFFYFVCVCVSFSMICKEAVESVLHVSTVQAA